MKRIRVKDLLKAEEMLQNINLKGWIRTKRSSKEVTFLAINDGSSLKNMQAVIDNTNIEPQTLDKLTNGSSVSILGDLVESPASGQAFELLVSSIEILGFADPESYPLQKKRHSFEFLRDIAHLRPRTNTFGAVFRVRNALSRAIHNFFQERDFLYVQTPIITANDCEGAGEMFQVTTLERITEASDYAEDFFGKKASLTVSGQLEGELFASAFDRIYTFGPTFRAENSHTSRHLSEFWMIEPEVAFNDIHDNMDLAETFLKDIISSVLAEASDDMAFFNQHIKKGVIEELEALCSSQFERVSYSDAIAMLEKADRKFEYPVSWGCDLQSEHERYLTEEKFKAPVILTDYPRTIKPFYMYCNSDEKTVRGMDVLVPGIGEIIGGSEREYRLDLLLDRMRELGLNEGEYDWYLDTRRFGSVPHAGFGLGFERLVQYVTGMENIRDVIPFPRTPKNIKF